MAKEDCPACKRGETKIRPPKSGVVGNMAVHQPSGEVCVKDIPQHIYDIMLLRRKKRQ